MMINVDVALSLWLPLSSSSMKTAFWTFLSTSQGFNSAGSPCRKGSHRFLLTRLVEPFSSNDLSSGGSPLMWK